MPTQIKNKSIPKATCCNVVIQGFFPSCDSKIIVHTNCKNCGANDFKNNQCNYCKTKY